MSFLAALVPYIAVLIGMMLFKSAWLAVALYHVGIVAFLVARKNSSLWQTLWAGARNPLTLPAALACALAAPLIYFMWPFFRASESILPEWLAAYGLTGWSWILLIPYFSIVHPIMEEAHWRETAPRSAPLIWWGDYLFAGYHVLVLHKLLYWPWLVLVFGVLVGASMFWRWAANRFNGYAVPILTHAAADAGVLIGVGFLLKHMGE